MEQRIGMPSRTLKSNWLVMIGPLHCVESQFCQQLLVCVCRWASSHGRETHPVKELDR